MTKAAAIERERRSTAGRRMANLVGQAAEDDDTFWNHDTWAESTGDGDGGESDGSFRESDDDEENQVDVFDSDFNDSESEDEEEEEGEEGKRDEKGNVKLGAAEVELRLEEKRERGKKKATGAYQEVAGKKKNAAASNLKKKKALKGEGINAGLVLNFPGAAPLPNRLSRKAIATPISAPISQPIVGAGAGAGAVVASTRKTGRTKPSQQQTIGTKRSLRASTITNSKQADEARKNSAAIKPTISRKRKQQKDYTQDELLMEAVQGTEAENLRWILSRKRALNEEATRVELNKKLASQNQLNGIVCHKFHSRRGCYNTITFPDMDLVPKIFTQNKNTEDEIERRKKESKCVITGKVARYRDPKTRKCYHDSAAFKELRRRLEAGEPLEQSLVADKPASSSVGTSTSGLTSNGDIVVKMKNETLVAKQNADAIPSKPPQKGPLIEKGESENSTATMNIEQAVVVVENRVEGSDDSKKSQSDDIKKESKSEPEPSTRSQINQAKSVLDSPKDDESSSKIQPDTATSLDCGRSESTLSQITNHRNASKTVKSSSKALSSKVPSSKVPSKASPSKAPSKVSPKTVTNPASKLEKVPTQIGKQSEDSKMIESAPSKVTVTVKPTSSPMTSSQEVKPDRLSINSINSPHSQTLQKGNDDKLKKTGGKSNNKTVKKATSQKTTTKFAKPNTIQKRTTPALEIASTKATVLGKNGAGKNDDQRLVNDSKSESSAQKDPNKAFPSKQLEMQIKTDYTKVNSETPNPSSMALGSTLGLNQPTRQLQPSIPSHHPIQNISMTNLPTNVDNLLHNLRNPSLPLTNQLLGSLGTTNISHQAALHNITDAQMRHLLAKANQIPYNFTPQMHPSSMNMASRLYPSGLPPATPSLPFPLPTQQLNQLPFPLPTQQLNQSANSLPSMNYPIPPNNNGLSAELMRNIVAACNLSQAKKENEQRSRQEQYQNSKKKENGS